MREPAVVLARDRHHAAIDVRRKGPVRRELGLTGRAALIRVGEVEKREPHGALDLQRPIPHEKHASRVRVDAFDRRPAMGGGIGEQRKDRLM